MLKKQRVIGGIYTGQITNKEGKIKLAFCYEKKGLDKQGKATTLPRPKSKS